MGMDTLPTFVATTIVVFAILALVFLALRWFVLWYWRINEAVDTLKQIALLLEEQRATARRDAFNGTTAPTAAARG